MTTSGRPNPIRSSPAFRRLWVARTISEMGDGIAVVALLLLVEATRHSGTAVAALLLAGSLPRFFGPIAGAVADRVEQRRLMVGCDFGNAAIFTTIAWLHPPFGVLIALVAASAALDTLFAPAGRSAVPGLVAQEDLVQANAWLGTALNLKVALGSLLGGALVAAVGARGALGANAVSFLLSAVTIVGLPPLRSSGPDSRRPILGVGVEGLTYAWRMPLVRGFLIVLFLGVAFAAVDNVALVFLVTQTLGGGPVAFGLASASFGVGMISVSIGLSWRRTSVVVGTLLLIGWAASGIGTALTGLAPVLIIVAIAQAVAGFGNGLENIAADTLVQQAVPREMLGRVFGLVTTAAFGGSTLAYAAGGPLLDLTSPRTVFLIGGAGTLLVTAFLWVILHRRSTHPTP